MRAVWDKYLEEHPDTDAQERPSQPEDAQALAEEAISQGSTRPIHMPGFYTYSKEGGRRRMVYWKITLDARVVTPDGELHTELMI
eukprot:3604238-Rhodomonas_salina.1